MGDRIKGVPETGAEENGSLPPLKGPINLRSCPIGGEMVYSRKLRRPVRQESPLLFIEIRGQWAFDAYNPEVFVHYCSKQQPVPQPPMMSLKEEAEEAPATALQEDLST